MGRIILDAQIHESLTFFLILSSSASQFQVYIQRQIAQYQRMVFCITIQILATSVPLIPRLPMPPGVTLGTH